MKKYSSGMYAWFYYNRKAQEAAERLRLAFLQLRQSLDVLE